VIARAIGDLVFKKADCGRCAGCVLTTPSERLEEGMGTKESKRQITK